MAYHKIVVLLVALLIAPFSHAGIETLFDRQGFAIYPATNAVEVRTVGSVSATAVNGSRALVPVTTAANVSRATMALNAAKLVRALSPVGAAITAYAIYDAVKASGVGVCPAPDFFCMPATPSAPYPYIWRETQNTSKEGTTPELACKAAWSFANGSLFPAGSNQFGPMYNCGYASGGTNASSSFLVQQVGKCQDGYTLTNGNCVANGSGTPVPYASDQALADAMQANDWNGTVSKKVWDAVIADMPKSPGTLSFKDALGANSPVTVSGSPVVGPQVTTSTKTTPNADGSTSTEVQKEQTTFTPSKDGSTVADAVPKISQSTVTTTTTTNNTTNVTNTTTTTATPPKSAEETPDLCKTNPDIVACQKLGKTLEATPVPNKDVPTPLTKDAGWGPENGSCPAPRTFTIQGKPHDFKFDTFCQYATGVRPILVGFAYLAAIFSFLGISKKD